MAYIALLALLSHTIKSNDATQCLALLQHLFVTPRKIFTFHLLRFLSVRNGKYVFLFPSLSLLYLCNSETESRA